MSNEHAATTFLAMYEHKLMLAYKKYAGITHNEQVIDCVYMIR